MTGREISENELARRTGVPQPTIHRVLSGRVADPRDGTLRPLATFFGVSVEQLRTAGANDIAPKNESPTAEDKRYADDPGRPGSLAGNQATGTFEVREQAPEYTIGDGESHSVQLEQLTLALQLVAEVLHKDDLALPPAKHAKVTALVYDLLLEGMPRAKELQFVRAAAA
jgi:transcriptional regulator with XRE-family HTH domain